MKASAIIKAAANVLDERGAERDQEGERSMARAVEVFNAMVSEDSSGLSESEGWLFMVALKLARAERSNNPDHYVDLVGYIALLGEHVLAGSQDAGLTAPKTQASSGACAEIPMPSPWIQHGGDGYPAGLEPDEVVETTLRNGSIIKGPVSAFFWHQGGFSSDILFYRKASKPEKDDSS